MKRKYLLIPSLPLLLSAIVFFSACEKDNVPSLFDPDQPLGDTPMITSIEPAGQALAGVGEVSINGLNFSSIGSQNFVFFNAEQAEVLSASSTQLVVRPPNLVDANISIKIAVQYVEQFSNVISYELLPAVIDYAVLEGPGEDSTEVFGLAVDRDENVYVSVLGSIPNIGLSGNKIKIVTLDGKASSYAATSFLRANAMRVGPGGDVYTLSAAGRVRKLSRFDGAGVETTVASFGATPYDFDFDASGNIWAAVKDDIYLVKPDNSRTLIDSYDVDLFALRVYENHVYVTGGNAETAEHKIWRSQINGDVLAPREVFFDPTAAAWLEGHSVFTIEFAADGDALLGTSHPSGVFVYHSDGSHEPLYPGLLTGDVTKIVWGNDSIVYAVQKAQDGATLRKSRLLRIDLVKQGAPYFGRQ